VRWRALDLLSLLVVGPRQVFTTTGGGEVVQSGSRPSLAEYREEVQRCMRCGFCRVLCPTWEFVGWESGTPRGRMQLVRGLLDGELEVNAYVADRVYKCALCGYCLWRCPAGVKTTETIRAARAHLVEVEAYPEALDRIDANVRGNHSLYDMAPGERADWVDYMDLRDLVRVGERAEVVYFPGCVASLSSRAMSVAAATSLILDHLGLDWTVLGGEEWCCGDPLLLSGKTGFAGETALHNLQAIRRLGARTLVTSCAGCYRAFNQEYPRLVGDPGLEVLHTSQLLERALREGRIGFAAGLDMTVTYHDPCELGRLGGVYEAPRAVLRAVPGARFMELARNRSLTRCCGGGGVLKATYPEIALRLGSRKLEEAHLVGAEAVVSTCPACKLNISDAASEENDPLQVLDLTEIVARAMNLRVT